MNEAQNYNDLMKPFFTFDPVAYERPNLPAGPSRDSRVQPLMFCPRSTIWRRSSSLLTVTGVSSLHPPDGRSGGVHQPSRRRCGRGRTVGHPSRRTPGPVPAARQA